MEELFLQSCYYRMAVKEDNELFLLFLNGWRISLMNYFYYWMAGEEVSWIIVIVEWLENKFNELLLLLLLLLLNGWRRSFMNNCYCWMAGEEVSWIIVIVEWLENKFNELLLLLLNCWRISLMNYYWMSGENKNELFIECLHNKINYGYWMTGEVWCIIIEWLVKKLMNYYYYYWIAGEKINEKENKSYAFSKLHTQDFLLSIIKLLHLSGEKLKRLRTRRYTCT